jgi:hypothetical protein
MPRLVPVMASEVPGNYVTGALWNANVKAAGDFLTGVPLFSAYAAAAQSVPNNVFTAMSLDTEVFDTDGGHSTVTNTSRYTCQVAGIYLLMGVAVLPASGAGTRGAAIGLNGSTTGIIGSEQLLAPSPAFATTIAPTPTYQRLAVGDYVSLLGWQNSGAAISTVTVGAAMTSFTAQWVSA